MGEAKQENNNSSNIDIKVFVGSTSIFDDKKSSKEEKIKQIKEILSKALQIDNLNFLLGAGCSSYEIKKIYRKINNKSSRDNHLKRIINKRKDIICNKIYKRYEYIENKYQLAISTMIGLFYDFIEKNDLNFLGQNEDEIPDIFNQNLENLLEYLISFDVVINKNKHSISIMKNNKQIEADTIQNTINDIKIFIIKAILDKIDSNEVIELYKLFYQKIINNNRKNPINIFTTNYDLYNETALDRLNFLYNNGFSGTVERKFNPMLYKYIYVENMNLNKDVWQPVSYFFNLIKLHGSISWEADREKLEIYENNNIHKDDKINKDDGINKIANVDKVMIYPSPLKDRSTLMTPYSDLFRFLENSLYLNNSTLIVIGYSFGDEHINRVIYNALANPTFRLIIFGYSDNIKKLIKRNDKRTTIIYSKKLENNDNKKEVYEPIHYFKYIVNNLLPSVNDDILEKERIDKIIKFLKENKLV